MTAGGTDVQKLTEQVALLKEQLAQAQKQTALGELVGTTTHEFNNVLMTIINYAKLGLKNPTGETATKAFEKILTAANRCARITNGILGFARNRTATFEATDMVKVVDDTLMLLERDMMKYRVQVERTIHPTPPAMAAPPPINAAPTTGAIGISLTPSGKFDKVYQTTLPFRQ